MKNLYKIAEGFDSIESVNVKGSSVIIKGEINKRKHTEVVKYENIPVAREVCEKLSWLIRN